MNISYCRYCYEHAHLFLSYHLIQVPCKEVRSANLAVFAVFQGKAKQNESESITGVGIDKEREREQETGRETERDKEKQRRTKIQKSERDRKKKKRAGERKIHEGRE